MVVVRVLFSGLKSRGLGCLEFVRFVSKEDCCVANGFSSLRRSSELCCLGFVWFQRRLLCTMAFHLGGKQLAAGRVLLGAPRTQMRANWQMWKIDQSSNEVYTERSMEIEKILKELS
ncbi:uncharacterized protein [Nicotiana tomentosiformis]|uniref:uncharacterized protein isoform X3 n=1 Tax=Nicotiana tomentosiformis TaxID=4098 RepID=UPI00388C7A93